MKEDFLHYVWQFRKFDMPGLKTVDGKPVEVVQPGTPNTDSGPDFFNAQLRIDGQLWAGNVEIHLRSADWYAHNHETDPAYDNVILHVVWEHDTDIFRKDNSALPTVEIKGRVDKVLSGRYRKLLAKGQKWINCEADFHHTDDFLLEGWLERLYVERLGRKTELIREHLKATGNNWDAVLFRLLAKNFGLKVNGGAFLSMAASVDFSVVQKTRSSPEGLEALFFGQAGLLSDREGDAYYAGLREKYRYLRKKFGLDNSTVTPSKFFRLRPDNFPTIRLAQLAALYAKNSRFFSELVGARGTEEIAWLFDVSTPEYWDTHYHFGTASKPRKKKLSPDFLHLIIINTVAPLQFCYARANGQRGTDHVLDLVGSLPAESNSIVKGFNSLRKDTATNALHSQALLTLKAGYCDRGRCLQCAVGAAIIGKRRQV